MNCDDFLEALESPDERLSAAARWHANACPSCAALAEVRDRLRTELAAVEPLPQRLRDVWKAAARDESPQAILSPRSQGRGSMRQLPMQIVSLAAAVLLLVTVGLMVRQRPLEMGEQPAPPSAAVARTIDASAELTELLAQVTALEAELKVTSKQAELVDVRRQADALLATYNHW